METAKISSDESGELDELISKHSVEITKLRELVSDVLPSSWDDIWLLRYILSNKTAADSADHVRFTIQWREKHRDVLESVAAGNPAPHAEAFSRYQVCGPHKGDKEGAPVFIVRAGICNQDALIENGTSKQIVEWLTFTREFHFSICDKLTRKRRRLVKSILIMDLRNLRLVQPNSTFMKALTESSQLSNRVYPQLMGISIPINIPSFFKYALSVAKNILPKRMFDKMKVCPGDTMKGDLMSCPYFASRFRKEDLPTFLGGTCNCYGGCVPGVPNSQQVPLTGVTSDGKLSLTVNAGAIEVAEAVCPEGACVVDFEVSVAFKNVLVSASLVPLHDCSKSEETLVLQPRRKVYSGDSFNGKWVIPSAGVVRLVFDNSDSVMTSKQISYKMSVKPIPTTSLEFSYGGILG